METPSPNSFRKIIHDMNSCLFIIRGNTDMALDINVSPEQSQQSLEEIRKATAELDPIVTRLRTKQKELAPEE